MRAYLRAPAGADPTPEAAAVLSSQVLAAGAARPAEMEAGEEPEPSELFGDLGTLVVEGRMPGGQRGFHEGPHCVLVYPYRQSRHTCDPKHAVCQRESELRRYMHLLWRNNIPMSVEVLVCPPCAHGAQRAASVDATPEPGYLLLEQWTVHMETAMRCQRGSVGARALLQAVYSYLHFSQLSAWLSRSGGALPRNVMYRITVPGDAFGTSFVGGTPQLHTFPTAYLARDRTMVQVSVRALPRCETVPVIRCSCCNAVEDEEALGAAAAAPAQMLPPGPGADNTATPSAAALWSDEDLRRSIVKCRLQGALSDSRDSLLGDSLLDPPRSLQKYPKRYQSPSRSGSPSLETPEHLMFGSRDSSSERRDDRSRGLSRHVITDQCTAEPDLAWTQGRAPWRRDRQLSATSCSSSSSSSGGSSRAGSSSPPHWCGSQPPEKRQTGEQEAEQPPPESQQRSRELEQRLCHTHQITADQDQAKRTINAAAEETPDSEQGLGSVGWSSRRTPQRSRSDDARLFRLTEDERRQVEDVLRRDIPPPRPPDNPLLSAIDRAGQVTQQPQAAAARTVRQVPAVQMARASRLPLRADLLSAQPLSPADAGRPVSSAGDRLVGLVRRALSFEEPPHGAASGDSEELDACRRRFSPAADGDVHLGKHDRDGSDRSANSAADSDESTTPRAAIQSCDKVANRDCEVSNGACSERILRPSGDSAGLRNGSGQRRTGGGDDTVQNGAPAVGEKGSRVTQTPNLLKRIFKREAEQERNPAEPRQPVRQPALTAQRDCRPSVRRSLDTAISTASSTAFSQRTGLPLSSSPAPLRRGTAFNFDAALTKVKTFSSALNELTDVSSVGGEQDEESRRPLSSSCPAGVVSSLLGSFEESVLNGRLGPVSTVEGFSAEIGASGSFHPRHQRLPVTVFFYSLSDNEKIASPYMGHVDLGRKGYHVPKKGTLQVTLFNPHGTVVKMFVVMYDLSEMPANSQTFLRQRTLYMPVGESPEHPNSQKWLRYLIHLRFATGRTGRMYVHTNLRMIIFRKSDMDAAALHTSTGVAHEMRSFVHMPDNPRFSPRK